MPHVLFAVSCLILTGFVLVPELLGAGKTKDYGLWYWAGQQVLSGGNLYPEHSAGYLPFLYPPFTAVLLALPSYFGKVPLYLVLAIVNSIAWWAVSRLSNAMTGAGRIPGPWLAALPSIATISFIFDQYDLGQPNLLLLALILAGFACLLRQRPIAAGALIGLATAIKVFPIAVLPYLLWRRQWRAALSMASLLVVLTLLVPSAVRGFERTSNELGLWAQAMTGGDSGFGQREAQNWSWVNQSLLAVTHRLLRPINYNVINPELPPRYINVVTLERRTADLVSLMVAVAIGLGFLLVIPRRAERSARSDAEELAILLCLVTIASPLARQYYFVWLFFPLTVLIHRAAFDSRPAARRLSAVAILLASSLLVLSLPIFPKILQALGNNLWATFVVIAGLTWHLLHPIGAVMAASAWSRSLILPTAAQA
jgi:hypothetical protein